MVFSEATFFSSTQNLSPREIRTFAEPRHRARIAQKQSGPRARPRVSAWGPNYHVTCSLKLPGRAKNSCDICYLLQLLSCQKNSCDICYLLQLLSCHVYICHGLNYMPSKTCWSLNPWYLWMWFYLQMGALQIWLRCKLRWGHVGVGWAPDPVWLVSF